MQILFGGLVWMLMIFMVVPPNLDYAHITMSVTAGSLSGPIILSSVLAAGLVACFTRLRLAAGLLRRVDFFLLAYVGLASLSLLWTSDPDATLRRLFRLYAIVIGCIGFALVGWHARRFQNVVRPILTLLLLGSLLFGLFAPELAIETSTFEGGITLQELVGAWRGLTMQKNSLGAIAATAIVLWVHALLSRETGPLRAMAGLGIAIACLVLSRSSTSVFATVLAVGFLVLLMRPPLPALRRILPLVVILSAAAILIYSLAVLDIVPGLGLLLAPITAITGKDMSFSGRTQIWALIKDQIAQHPVLGIGYSAYWTGPVPTSPSYEMLQRLQFYPTAAHNGYLDVINELGFAGGICLLAYLAVYLRQALRLMKIDRYQGGLYLALLFQGLVGNLSESHWLNVNSVDFLIFTLATTALARGLMEPDGAVDARVPFAPYRSWQRPRLGRR